MRSFRDVTCNVNTLDYSRTRFGQAMLPSSVYACYHNEKKSSRSGGGAALTDSQGGDATVECWSGTTSRCTGGVAVLLKAKDTSAFHRQTMWVTLRQRLQGKNVPQQTLLNECNAATRKEYNLTTTKAVLVPCLYRFDLRGFRRAIHVIW